MFVCRADLVFVMALAVGMVAVDGVHAGIDGSDLCPS